MPIIASPLYTNFPVMIAEARGGNPFEQFAGHAACRNPLSLELK